MFCEKLMQGGQTGYDDIIPGVEDEKKIQGEMKKIRQEKRKLRKSNLILTEELSELIEKILNEKCEIKDILGEESESELLSNQFLQELPTNQLGSKINILINNVKSRLHELEEYQSLVEQYSGIKLEKCDKNSATLILETHSVIMKENWENLNVSKDIIDPKYSLNIEWNPERIITSAFVSPKFPIDDIVEICLADSDFSFLIREVSHRLVCMTKRQLELNNIQNYLNKNLKNSIIEQSTLSLNTILLKFELKNQIYLCSIFSSLEYPQTSQYRLLSVKIQSKSELNQTDSDQKLLLEIENQNFSKFSLMQLTTYIVEKIVEK